MTPARLLAVLLAPVVLALAVAGWLVTPAAENPFRADPDEDPS